MKQSSNLANTPEIPSYIDIFLDTSTHLGQTQIIVTKNAGFIINKELFAGFKETAHTNSSLISALKFDKLENFYDSYNIQHEFGCMYNNPELKSLTVILDKSKMTTKEAIEIINALQLSKSLTKVTLNFVQIKFLAGPLADVLKINNKLIYVDLGHNSIGDQGAGLISESLKANSSITYLGLQNNNIKVKGAKYIAKALAENDTLTTLNMELNNISNEGVKALYRVLEQKNHSIVSIQISLDGLNNTVIANLNKALDKNLQHLDISEIKSLQSSFTGLEDKFESIREDKGHDEAISIINTMVDNISDGFSLIETRSESESIIGLGPEYHCDDL